MEMCPSPKKTRLKIWMGWEINCGVCWWSSYRIDFCQPLAISGPRIWSGSQGLNLCGEHLRFQGRSLDPEPSPRTLRVEQHTRSLLISPQWQMHAMRGAISFCLIGRTVHPTGLPVARRRCSILASKGPSSANEEVWRWGPKLHPNTGQPTRFKTAVPIKLGFKN